MMTQESDHPSREDLSALALGALDATDIAAVNWHVASCVDCQRILAKYKEVAEGLSFAMPPQVPPPQLRTKLAEAVRVLPAAQIEPAVRIDSPALPQPAPKTVLPDRSDPQRPAIPSRSSFSWIQIGPGLVLLALLALNVGLLLQVRSLRQQQQVLLQLLQENQTRLAFVSQPGIRTLPVGGTQGAGNLVIYPEGNQAVLFLRDLPELEPGRSYQVWLIPSESAPESAGLIERHAGQPYLPFLVTPQTPLRNYLAIGVSVEPEGGSPAPTTDPILLVNL